MPNSIVDITFSPMNLSRAEGTPPELHKIVAFPRRTAPAAFPLSSPDEKVISLSRAIAKAHKKCSASCAIVDKFCVQLAHKLRHSWGITRQLSIASNGNQQWDVAKAGDKPLMLPTRTHKKSTTFLTQITDTFAYLPTLSTGPITTTTNIFN
jgi:hypothetical protein